MAFSTYNSIQRGLTIINTFYKYIFAVDASLVLFYPFDSKNTTSKTPNYASGQAVYDGTMYGTSQITTATNTYITSIADLSLNNTAGSTATNYIVATNTFQTVPSNGLSISCWFSCSGQLNTNQTLFSLPLGNTNGVNITISNMNTINSNVLSYLQMLSGSNYLINNNKYVFTGGTYTILANSTYTITYLIVGGGGAGGTSHGGGGGAGGVLSGTISLTAGINYTITVGLGGIPSSTLNGTSNGGNSSIAGSGITTITAYGGGYGGGDINGSAYSAQTNSSIIGSGGGGSGYTYTNTSSRYAGQTNSGQGNNGGFSNTYTTILNGIGGGGGGGGSSTIGLPSSTTIGSGGAGGNGTTLYSSILTNITSMMNSFVSEWSTATNGYIASGGGGGSWGEATYDPGDTVLASGGLGGGGTGGNTGRVVPATAGFPNTGSGGGGGAGGGGVGGNGGSGLVVIIFS